MGSVDEPYLGGTPEIGVFMGRWLYFGFTFGEAAYACQSALSWQTTVVGDPLYRPFGKNPLEQHNELEARKSKWLEWSILRIANLTRARGIGATQVATILEDTPTTKESAVLTEKLASLYSELGKPSSAIAAYEKALTLNPSPQQRIRLRLTLGEKFTAAKRNDEARTNYQKLLQEAPDYPDAVGVGQKLAGIPPAQDK
jgi:tetratricopeptide (TPR) repeat protein